MDNRSLSHTRWKCQYHIVFIPKYRKRILYGRLREDVKEIISTLCKYRKVDIIAGAVCKDHVHLSVVIPPKESISDFMGYLKALIVKVVVSKNIYFLFVQVIRYCSVPDVSINKLSTFIGNHVRHRILPDHHHFE